MPRLFAGLVALFVCAFAEQALAFTPAGRWTSTATNASTGPTGNAATITWSIVPDGAWIATEDEPSNLVAFLDGLWGAGPGGSDYTRRPWFWMIDDAFGRWSEVGGVNFVYEPHDDGVEINGNKGQLGVRGDLRVSGALIDGPLKSLGYNLFPVQGGDMVVDTGDGGYFSADGALNRRFRNHLMHELGHGLGLAHVNSSDASFLLEPSNNTSFDGPQYDDILGLHGLYGDVFEQTNNNLGNDTLAHAAPLGTLSIGGAQSIGRDAYQGPAIAGDATDFVSLSNQYDVDYYSFHLDQPAYVDLLLAPLGPTYQIGSAAAWNTSAVSDLRLTLYDSAGEVLRESNANPAGAAEGIQNIRLAAPGDYVVGVSGNHFMPQMYLLHLAADAVGGLPGDFNFDGEVDAADYNVWRDSLGRTGATLAADVSAIRGIDQAGYETWKHNFGRRLGTTRLPGDYNFDGRVDAADYSVWRDALGQTGLDLAADGTADGVVDQADYQIWKRSFASRIEDLTTPLPGDFNDDGAVDAADYTVWRNTLGQVGIDLAADADGNYLVDDRDYALWKSHFGAPAGALVQSAAVPEPTGAAVATILVAMFGVAWRARGVVLLACPAVRPW